MEKTVTHLKMGKSFDVYLEKCSGELTRVLINGLFLGGQKIPQYHPPERVVTQLEFVTYKRKQTQEQK